MEDKVYDAALGLLKLSMMKGIPFEVDKKIKKTLFQIKVLERIFEVATLPSTTMQTDLALLLKIPRRSIQVWFQNARQARRRKYGTTKGRDGGEHDDFNDMSIGTMLRIIEDVRLSLESH
jgi:hypothetical protein